MSTEEQKKVSSESLGFKEREKIDNPAELLQNSISGLDKFGGFQLLKGLIKGVENMDPRRKAVKNIFLSDSAYSDARKRLINELSLWIELLDKGGDPMEIIDSCKTVCEKAENNLMNNLFCIHDEIKNLEVTYRALDSFFANAGQGEIASITLMNVNKEELGDNDSDDTTAIRSELKYCYDKLSIKDSYSMLVVPGYLGDADTVRMWAETAYKYKVIMVTDFKDSMNYEMLKNELEDANLQGQEAKLSNVIMTCNYILGRKKSEIANEDEDLYIPASAALAGKMSNTEDTVIAQGIAGMKYGTLSNIKGARMDLLKSETASLIDLGVIPMVEVDGRTVAFSNRSLYNGATQSMQEYPIVRVVDWIGKVLQHFCNYEAFTKWDSAVRNDLREAVIRFLDQNRGPEGLYESYFLGNIEQDPDTKNIKIPLKLKPFFAANNFNIEITTKKSEDFDWSEQENS